MKRATGLGEQSQAGTDDRVGRFRVGSEEATGNRMSKKNGGHRASGTEPGLSTFSSINTLTFCRAYNVRLDTHVKPA